MTTKPTSDDKVTRRQFAGLLGGVSAGLLTSAACSRPPSPATQEKPMPPTTPPAPAVDSRLSAVEKLRGAPLTEAQKQNLPAKFKEIDETGEALRKFVLEDGGSEPGTIFHPTTPARNGEEIPVA